MSEPDTSALIKRIEYLEHVVAELRAKVEGGSVEGGSSVAAEQLRLVNESGHARALLALDDDETPFFALLDQDGQPRLSLKLDAEGHPVQRFFDRFGITRLRIDVDDRDQPSVLLCDSNANGVARVYVDEELPCVILADPDGTIRGQFGLDVGNLPSLILDDDQGTTRVKIAVDAAGNSTLVLLDEKAKPIARLGLDA